MKVPLNTPLCIRQLEPGDLDVAENILKNSFTTPGNRRPDLERGMRLQPQGWWLGLLENVSPRRGVYPEKAMDGQNPQSSTDGAILEGEPVGMVGAVEYDHFAWVGMMGVTHAHQSKGIGRALMNHLLTILDTRKNLVLLDASDAGKPLYESLGFEDEGLTHLYERMPTLQKAPARPRISGPHGSDGAEEFENGIIRTATLADLSEMVEFDLPIFGADRGAVFQDLLACFPNRGFLIHDISGKLQGILWAQSRRLGPWVASGGEAAELLLQRALTLTFDGAPQIIAPDLNSLAAPLYARYGFGPLLANCHMRRGGKCLTGLRTHVFGQASFGIG